MARLLRYSFLHPYLIIACLGAATCIAVISALDTQLDVSSDQLLPSRSPLLDEYHEIRDTFGSDKIAAVFVEDAELFTSAKLGLLKGLDAELADVSGVQRIDSLFTVNHINSRDGLIDVGPLLHQIPDSVEELQALRREATGNPILRRTVISADGKATLFTLYLDETLSAAIENSKEPNFNHRVYEDIEAVLARFEGNFKFLYQVGAPAVQESMSQLIISDQRYLLPISALIMVGLIGLTLRSLNAAIIPVLNAAVSTVWTLGLMALLGIPINMLNYIVPVLILVVGATEDVHILTEYRDLRLAGRKSRDAIADAGRRIGLTLVLTATTTVIGFSATGLIGIQVMQEFAVTAASGMVFRFAATLFLLPAYLSIAERFGGGRDLKLRDPSRHWLDPERAAAAIMGKLVTRPITVISFFLIIAIPSFYFASKVTLNNDLFGFLKEGSPTVSRTQRAALKLSGPKAIFLTLKGNPGDFRSAAKLDQLFRVSNTLNRYPEFDSVVSLADYIALIHREMSGGDPKDFKIPDNDPLIAQYLLFFRRSDIQRYINADFSQANMIIRTNVNNSTEFNRLMDRVRDLVDSGDFGPQIYTLTGKALLVSAAVDKIAIGQVTSLSTVAGLLFASVSVLFLSIRCGVMAVVTNLFSVAVVFGIMGLFKIPLNVGTCMVAAVTIGIGVDDTLHLMVSYNKELKGTQDERRAIHQALVHEILPVLVTSIGLAGGFLTLAFSSFVPVQQFGILSAFVIVVAVVADLVLAPTLLSTIRLITLWDLIGMDLRRTLRQKSRLLHGMSQMQVKKLLLLSNLVDCSEGTRIITEGDWGEDMYIVIDGELEVSKMIGGERRPLARLQLGDAFGEIALIARVKRTADVIARTDAKLLSVDWNSLEKLRRTSPRLAARVFLNLARILGLRFVQRAHKRETH